jgi:hypothetical protein
VRRSNYDGGVRCRIEPTMENTTAGKDERVRSAAVEDGQLEIAIKRRCRYGLPFHSKKIGQRREL